MNTSADICIKSVVTVKEENVDFDINVKQELQFAADVTLTQLKEEYVVKDEITMEPHIIQCTYYPVEKTATTSNAEQAHVETDAQNISGMQAKKRKIEIYYSPKAEKFRNFFGMPIREQLRTKKGKKNVDDGRRTRNLAIARYYEKKTEKLELEINLLRTEKQFNCICNCKVKDI